MTTELRADRLDQLFSSIAMTKIGVVGDLMLDRYVWGRVDRISPEAPVPVVTLEGESQNLGGAANVASNIGSLGASPFLFGVVGDDDAGRQMRALVGNSRYGDRGVITDPARPTSVKTRVISHSQHIVRIDQESLSDIPDHIADQVLLRFTDILPSLHGVILEDYNKGVLSAKIIGKIIAASKEAGVPVGVDPKWNNFWTYHGATLMKPNLKELEAGVGRALKTDSDIAEAAEEVISKLGLAYLLVTRGERGMGMFADGQVTWIPTRASRVHDVSGAGDTVIATVLTALAAGADIHEAALLGNFAASVVIAEVGAVPVERDELRRAVLSGVRH